jgi:hypothetical protein
MGGRYVMEQKAMRLGCCEERSSGQQGFRVGGGYSDWRSLIENIGDAGNGKK